MFYSHDLLGRKTPLGAIWTLAHGRKLSKGKIISINLREICQEILQPGVPHSLRLQGILIGGLVIVYNKQQAYLLEDLQEMMRKVKAAGKGGSAGGDGVGSSAAAERNTLKKGRNQAKLEAITLMDMEDLLAPMGDTLGPLGADDFMMLGTASGSGLNFSIQPSSSSEGGSRGSKRRRGAAAEDEEEVADGLFVMPSLPSGPALSDLTGSRDQHSRPSRSRSRGLSWATDSDKDGKGQQEEQLQQAEEELYGGLAHGGMGPWQQEDEMFDVNADLDLLGGMDLGGPHYTAADNDAAATSEQQQRSSSKPGSAATTPASSDLAGGRDPTLLPSGADLYAIPEGDFDQQLDQFDRDFEQLPTLEPTPAAGAGTASEGRGGEGVEDAAAQQDRAEGDTAEGADAKPAVRKSKKRKAAALIVDHLDNLQIRSKVYRDWVTDHSGLINYDLLRGTAGPRGLLGGAANTISFGTLASLGVSGLSGPSLALPGLARSSLGRSGQQALDPGALLSDPTPLYARLGLGAGAGGVGLCGDLQELFRAPVEAAAAASEERKQARKYRQPSSPEVNNSTDLGHISIQQVQRSKLHLTRTTPGGEPILEEGDEQQQQQQLDEGDLLDPALMVMPEIEEQEEHMQQQHEALSNDEAHDQLMELPFADVEVERLRAAGTTSPASGSLHLTSPRGAAAAAAAKRAESGTSGSSLMQGLPYEGPEIGSIGAAAEGPRRTLRMSDAEGQQDLGMYFGGGNIDDLLPDIPLPDMDLAAEEEEEEQQQQAEPGVERGSGSRGPGSSSLVPNSSQYPLLEETENQDATQVAQLQAGAMTQASRKVLSIFRERLRPAVVDETQDEEEEAAAAGAERSISLFGLMKDGRLSRSAAATLFYQVCVTSSAGYISASQERAFGDIQIRAGGNMAFAA